MEIHSRIGRVTFKPGFQPGARASAPLPAYDAGAGTSRRQSSWLTTSSGVNTALIGHVATLRNRARDQIRKNPWAGQIISSFVANAIGTGIKPKSKHPSEAVRETLHAAWLDWTDESDPEGVGDFYAQQALVVRAIFESGEAFVRFRPRRLGDGPKVPLQLQVIEADHVPLSENRLLPGRNVVIAGVEFDAQGRRVAYHMYREHPGEFLSARPRGLELERVPAAEILHVFDHGPTARVLGLVAGRVVDATRNAWRNSWRNSRRNSLRAHLALCFAGALAPPAELAELGAPFGLPSCGPCEACGGDGEADHRCLVWCGQACRQGERSRG